MDHSTLWWLMTGAAVVAELLTGTFYLLMLAIGLAAGAIAAHLGFAMPTQLLVAAVVGGGAVVACYLIRKRSPGAQPAASNRDVNLDVGETVQVDAWNPDGTAQVRYRGAQWTVLLRPGNAPSPGPYRVAEVVGSRLLVDKL
ncbi:NfeD family protein [Stenotrophomonas sp. YIM B06876]|uniref:NfeD family protein n=1 Tax=Stenotrophomonas sp. YIM B06876 TaxID=3060211 RepID=UPI00273873E3|nr:NfeD family protein [Stenotrophomonas sp. YIM B06876]